MLNIELKHANNACYVASAKVLCGRLHTSNTTEYHTCIGFGLTKLEAMESLFERLDKFNESEFDRLNKLVENLKRAESSRKFADTFLNVLS